MNTGLKTGLLLLLIVIVNSWPLMTVVEALALEEVDVPVDAVERVEDGVKVLKELRVVWLLREDETVGALEVEETVCEVDAVDWLLRTDEVAVVWLLRTDEVAVVWLLRLVDPV